MPRSSSPNAVPEGWSDYVDDLEVDDIFCSTVPGRDKLSSAMHWVENPKPVMCTVPDQRLYIAQSGGTFYLWKIYDDDCYKIEGVKTRKALIQKIREAGVEGLSLMQLEPMDLPTCGGTEPPFSLPL